MQFRVPQNITMEDKIIGSLTAMQFGILVMGGLLSFFMYTGDTFPRPLNILVGGGLAFLTVMLALFRFNGQPMYRFFRFFLLFLVTPKMRVWKKSGTEPALIRATQQKADANAHHAQKQVTKSDLAKLAAVIDSRGQIGAVPPVTKEQNTNQKK